MKPVTFLVIGKVGRWMGDSGVGYAMYDSSFQAPMIFSRKEGSGGGGVEQSRRVYMSPLRSSYLVVSIDGEGLLLTAGALFVEWPFVYGLLGDSPVVRAE